MSRTVSSFAVSLSRLLPSRRNPRKVRPAKEAHRRMVALLRSQGLLQPLVVRPAEDDPKSFIVVDGHRRLAGLREIHQKDGDSGDPKIPCILREVSADEAEALSLGANWSHAAMHPLDEAESFSRLASREGKDPAAIAAEFGVPEHYVRQRSKLAALAGVVKAAYRAGGIDTATAEAFASVPAAKQAEVWTEMNGHPRHADHVRSVIAHGWIDAATALFDVSTLPESAVSRDLFGEKLLIERHAFMAAQGDALAAERAALVEEGWKDAVAGRWEDVYTLTQTMDRPEREFDDQTSRQLEKIAERSAKYAEKLEQLPEDDEAGQRNISAKLEALEHEERELVAQAPVFYSEAIKAVGTAFLMLCPDGTVRREFMVPRVRRTPGHENGNGHNGGGDGEAAEPPKPPTSDDLKDGQRAATFTHEAIAVREALLSNDAARKRVLALILHDKVHAEALSIRHDANGTTILATKGEQFASAAFERLKEKRAKLDPLADDYAVDDLNAYMRIGELSPTKLDALIDLLVTETLTAHMQRQTKLIRHLSAEMKVNLRDHWRPDAAWLSYYQKIQLSHLMAELRGPLYSPARETRKKSELVEALASLFADAADGKLDDKPLADRVNRWLPSNMREQSPAEAVPA